MLEEYFDFLAPDDIRPKGSRVGIETFLCEHFHRARTPEEIQGTFPSLTLDQVNATILYRCLAGWLEFSRRARAEQDQDPSPAVARLRALKAEVEASGLSPENFLRERTETHSGAEELVAAWTFHARLAPARRTHITRLSDAVVTPRA